MAALVAARGGPAAPGVRAQSRGELELIGQTLQGGPLSIILVLTIEIVWNMGAGAARDPYVVQPKGVHVLPEPEPEGGAGSGGRGRQLDVGPAEGRLVTNNDHSHQNWNSDGAPPTGLSSQKEMR